MIWKGLVYRAHHPRWAFAATSGDGAARFGGRFNPIGMPALYTSLYLQTAWLEAQQGFPLKAQPMTVCCFEVDCADMRDLTQADPAIIGCSWESLARAKKTPPSWTLVRQLLADGAAGALVPSFAPGAGRYDVNAVFWRWADVPPNQVRLIDQHNRLPTDDGSWM